MASEVTTRICWDLLRCSPLFIQRKDKDKHSASLELHKIQCTNAQVLECAYAHIYKSMTMGEYLKRHGYSLSFQHNYLLPMCAAVWSVPNRQV